MAVIILLDTSLKVQTWHYVHSRHTCICV